MMDPYATGLPPLASVIINTTGPVLELGVGDYSTLLLHELCKNRRKLISIELESELIWIRQYCDLISDFHVIESVESWSDCPYLQQFWDVVFVDCKTGEDRVKIIQILIDKVNIFIIHDSDQPTYNYENVLPIFKYRFDYKRIKPWTSVVSNSSNLKFLI